MYLWRTVDQDGDLINVQVQKRKDKKVVKGFYRKMIKHQGTTFIRITTDKLRGYEAAIETTRTPNRAFQITQESTAISTGTQDRK